MYFLPHAIKSIQAQMATEHRSSFGFIMSNRVPLTHNQASIPALPGLPIRIFISILHILERCTYFCCQVPRITYTSDLRQRKLSVTKDKMTAFFLMSSEKMPDLQNGVATV